MNKKPKSTAFSTAPFSSIAKAWLLFFTIINFLFGFVSLISFLLPFVLLSLVNTLGITNLLKCKRTGFYLLFSSLIVNLIYSIFTKQSLLFFLATFLGTGITWIFLRKYADNFHA